MRFCFKETFSSRKFFFHTSAPKLWNLPKGCISKYCQPLGMPAWAAVPSCTASPAVLPEMLGSIWSWGKLASLLSCAPLFCAAIRGQMQFWVLGAAQAQHVLSTFPVKRPHLGSTCDLTLFDGYSWELYTHRNWTQSLTLAQALLEEAASLFYLLTSHISSWEKRPQVASRWSRSDIRKHVFTGRVVRHWNSGKGGIQSFWSV